MAYVTVPKDLTRVKSKIVFGLTKRQLICFGGALLVGVPLYFLLRGRVTGSAAALIMVFAMLPGFLLALYERHGQPLEVVVWQIVQCCFIQPKERPYQTDNAYFCDEFHLLLREEQTAAFSCEIWKRFRKWGGIPTGATQNVKDLLSSPEIENILENSDFICLLNQASGDRRILAERLNISPQQLRYVDNSEPGEGLLIYENVILPFRNPIPQRSQLYKIMTTRLGEGETV